LGDGHISHFQVIVSLGNKEEKYANYVRSLIKKIFKTNAKISIRRSGYRDIYLGSVDITRWLKKHGLVCNKVKSQVDIPQWVFSKKDYSKNFIKGFFDTDGSIYKLKYGVQISFRNRSSPLLKSLHSMLKRLEYSPSKVSSYAVYLTKKDDIRKFMDDIKPANLKHVSRYLDIKKLRR
jgi:DNA-binding transcriptional regulator WhiA